jgi:hypothetical protein
LCIRYKNLFSSLSIKNRKLYKYMKIIDIHSNDMKKEVYP